MTVYRKIVLSWAIVWLTAASVLAQWTEVAPGIEYRSFTIAGPNRVFVTRMDRNHPDCIIESSIGSGYLRDGRETVTGMANRYQDTINYWGQDWGNRTHVVAAINGDYFNPSTGMPTSGQIHSGWQCRRFMEYSGGSGFVWKLNRDCFIGGNVRNGTVFDQQRVYFANGSYMVPTRVNEPRLPNSSEFVVYTCHYAEHTYTDNNGVEVLVEMSRPLVALPQDPNLSVDGIVRSIRQNAGSTPIPFDHVVLSASGSQATQLLNNVAVGDTIKFRWEIKDYGTEGQVPTPPADWTKAYASIGGAGYVLKNGIVPSSDWAGNIGAIERHPRTAVAYNDNYVFFVVCDGRSTASIGMTFTEVGQFCRDYLGATHAITQDGGGSSALWVNGQIKNVPSDGPERAVANGLLMVNVRAKEVSTRFQSGQPVRTKAVATPRLGPGNNYGELPSVPALTTGTVLNHPLRGVRATGTMWWKVQFGDATGWVDETLLESAVRRVPDFDGDGDVDQEDFGTFQRCISGATVPQSDPSCAAALLDVDDDVDAADFAIFEACYSGPRVDYIPGCEE